MKSLILFTILITNLGHSQSVDHNKELRSFSREGGGGDLSVAQKAMLSNQIYGNILEIRNFFEDYPQVKKEFPEVDFGKFNSDIDQLQIKVLNYRPTDRYGIERTAVHYPDTKLINYYGEDMLEMVNDFPRALFVLNFHELIAMQGVEESKPVNILDIDAFRISSRLVKYFSTTTKVILHYPTTGDERERKCRVKFKANRSSFVSPDFNVAREQILNKGYVIVTDNNYDYVIEASLKEGEIGGGGVIATASILDPNNNTVIALKRANTHFGRTLSVILTMGIASLSYQKGRPALKRAFKKLPNCSDL